MLEEKLVPGDGAVGETTVLDQRFLATPSVALARCHDAVIQMGKYAQSNYRLAVELHHKYDAKKLERLTETETALDKMQDALDNYLVKLTTRALSPQENASVSELLHALGDFERIGDYSVNVAECATALHEKGQVFSPIAARELDSLTAAVDEALEKALGCYTERSYAEALLVEPIEEVVDLMREDLRSRHIERLKAGACTVELGSRFLELLITLERISDHCSNIAIQILHETAPTNSLVHVDTHAYTHELHHGHDAQFEELYSAAKAKYYDPVMTEDVLGTEE